MVIQEEDEHCCGEGEYDDELGSYF